MKIKNNNKGKVYPSPSSSSNGEYLYVLTLLPAAILALTSVLPLEDREVLAYLITRSIKTTTTAATTSPSSSIVQKKSSKKTANAHKPPVFACECFDCYTSYWIRWDSSANRELIHQVIEAFEDHLAKGESEKSKKNGKAKRRDKTARRFADNNKLVDVLPAQPRTSLRQKQAEETAESSITNTLVVAEPLTKNEVAQESSLQDEATWVKNNEVLGVAGESRPTDEEETLALALTTAAGSCSHKGFARKVLPDVLGLFNSRLWSLWSPNV